MKKLSYLLFFVIIASLTIISSCTDDDEPLPTLPTLDVDVVPAPDQDGIVSQDVGEDVVFNASGTAEAGFNVIRFDVYLNGNLEADYSEEFARTPGGDIPTTFSETFTLTLLPEWAGELLEVEIEVVDEESGITSDDIVIDVLSPEARIYSTILLAAPLQDQTSLTFFSTNTGERYSMENVLTSSQPISASIDFGYFYGSGNLDTEATLAAPASYPFAYGQDVWAEQNQTTFRTTNLDASAFNELISFADIDEIWEAADPADDSPYVESNLTEGAVLAFETDADKDEGPKKGVILINSISGADGVDGEISLDIIVQETP
ncbi:MAG: hypothetical protein ACNS62_16780 [Candidatus Cyclobacteriaceae bacterium M3_2C_046]